MLRPQPGSTLFPYTTLFRSENIRRWHSRGGLEVDAPVFTKKVAAVTAIVSNQRIGSGMKRSRFADNLRAGRVFLREQIQRISIQTHADVFGSDFKDALRIPGQMRP